MPARIPIGTAIRHEKAIAMVESKNVTGNARDISSTVDLRVWYEYPKSPDNARDNQLVYWIYQGLSDSFQPEVP